MFKKDRLNSKILRTPEIFVSEMEIVCENKENCYYIPSPYLDMRIPTSSNLSIPKSGRYFAEVLKNIDFNGKDVLDVGTGYFGYLARIVEHFGARKVVAVDINVEAIVCAKKFDNTPKIDFKVSDVYSGISPGEKFDILISNPAQLPSNSGGKVHDFGGKDGLDVIYRIIEGFPKFSKNGGILYLLVFDFLYDKVRDFCKNHDLSCDKIGFYDRKIRKGGETEKRIEYIQSIYEGYRFRTDNGTHYHQVYILEIKS